MEEEEEDESKQTQIRRNAIQSNVETRNPFPVKKRTGNTNLILSNSLYIRNGRKKDR